MTAQELLDNVLPRLTKTAGVDFLQAVNAALCSIGKRLAARRSDLSKSPIAVNYLSGDDAITLPAQFLGFSEKPATATMSLTLLTEEERESLTRPGEPSRYELRGSSLYLYPLPETAGTITVMAYCLPAPVTTLTAALPWNSLFDDLLREGVYKIMAMGLVYVATAEFEALVAKEVDQLLTLRSPRPKRARGTHF